MLETFLRRLVNKINKVKGKKGVWNEKCYEERVT
jgi:hypothetical protein